MQRNFGVALGYIMIAMSSLQKGLNKLQSDPAAIARDIDDAWEVLAEPIQTVMRRYAIPEPYEKLKALTRGRAVDKAILHEFIGTLEIPEDEKSRLLEMTPSSYTGMATSLARSIVEDLTETGRFIRKDG